jgi:hypothetical protein
MHVQIDCFEYESLGLHSLVHLPVGVTGGRKGSEARNCQSSEQAPKNAPSPSVHLVAVKDWMVKPTFQPLDFSEYSGNVGAKIQVLAQDDIGLASVIFTLTAIDGTQLEPGPAVEDGVRTGDWIYTATVPVPLGADIFVEARGVDHAGNKTACPPTRLWEKTPELGEQRLNLGRQGQIL